MGGQIYALIPFQTHAESTGSQCLPEISARSSRSTLQLNDERINMRCLPHRAAGLCLRSLPTQRNIHFIYYLYIESVSSCLFFEMDVCSPVPRSSACYDTKLILCARQLLIDPLSKQICYMATTKLWPLDGTTPPRWSFFCLLCDASLWERWQH